jgi:hypothetical protein
MSDFVQTFNHPSNRQSRWSLRTIPTCKYSPLYIFVPRQRHSICGVSDDILNDNTYRHDYLRLKGEADGRGFSFKSPAASPDNWDNAIGGGLFCIHM